MATITITIPVEEEARVINALCEGITPTGANAKARIISIVKDITNAYEYRQLKDVEDAKVELALAQKQAAVAAILVADVIIT